MQDKTDNFIKMLYKEKELHKEHRHKHLIQKLILSSSFFGIGQLLTHGSGHSVFQLFLYIVPPVAILHDIYIFAEDYKIKRIGIFLSKLPRDTLCIEELCWETRWLSEYRERMASLASFAYSILITVFTAVALYEIEIKFHSSQALIFWIWLSLCLGSLIICFAWYLVFRTRVKKMHKDSIESFFTSQVKKC